MKQSLVSCVIAAFTVLGCGVFTSCDQDSDADDEWNDSEVLSLANKKLTRGGESLQSEYVTSGSASESYESNDKDSIKIKIDYSWDAGLLSAANLKYEPKLTLVSCASCCSISNLRYTQYGIHDRKAFVSFTATVSSSKCGTRCIDGTVETTVSTYWN